MVHNSPNNDEVMAAVQNDLNTLKLLLPLAHEGLNVNPRFASVSSFEFMPEILFFDYSRVKLFHLWVADSSIEGYDIVKKLSYNEAMNLIVQMDDVASPHEPTPVPVKPAKVSDILQEPIIEIESASPLNDSVEDAVVVKVDAQAAEMENLFDDVVSSDPIKQNEFIVDEASSSKEDLEESEVSDTQPNLSALIPPLPTPSPPPQSSSSSSQEDLDAKTAQAIWNGAVAEAFISSTGSQITEIGISQLKDELEEGEMAVLYINGHFSTVTKHGDFLYVLCTDIGYLGTHIIWLRMEGTKGDFAPCDYKFREVLPEKPPKETDEELAVRLQRDEQIRYQEHERKRQERALAAAQVSTARNAHSQPSPSNPSSSSERQRTAKSPLPKASAHHNDPKQRYRQQADMHSQLAAERRQRQENANRKQPQPQPQEKKKGCAVM